MFKTLPCDLSIEYLNASFDANQIREQYSSDQEDRCRKLIKFGVAALILDDNDRALVVEHEARDGEYGQNALGPSMETSRYVPAYGAGMTEKPLETLLRCIDEELPNEEFSTIQERISAAELFIARDSIVSFDEWDIGVNSTGDSDFYAAVSICLRTSNPDVLLPSRRSEEALSAFFLPIEAVLSSTNTRPGFIGWLNQMSDRLVSDRTSVMPISCPEVLPVTGPDVRFD